MSFKQLINELKKNKNVIAAFQFGSHGTSRQTPFSDIDICLFTKDTTKKTILELSSYGTDLIDISLFDTLPMYIKPEVFKGKPLFVKDKFLIAEKFAKAQRAYIDSKKYEEAHWKALRKRLINR